MYTSLHEANFLGCVDIEILKVYLSEAIISFIWLNALFILACVAFAFTCQCFF